MPVTTRTALGASTTNRQWYLDVDTSGIVGSPSWVPVMGLMEFQPSMDPNLEDDSDFDSGGYQSQTKTAEAWAIDGKLARKLTVADPTMYDPGQEFLRAKAIGQMGQANQAHIRYYEMTAGGPRAEAYEGYAAVTWSPDGGAMTALNTVSLKLTGQGRLLPVTHPASGSVIPSIVMLGSTTGPAAGGDLVTIRGAGFLGMTSVKFGTTTAPEYNVVSDTVIDAVAPAKTAGTYDVTVTNAAGTSAVSAATKYVYV